jgi:ATP-binding cassette subfamily B protein
VTPPELTENERARASGARTLRKVATYLWPADKAWVKRRVVWAMIALVVSKLVAIGTPFFFGQAVDAMDGEGVNALAIGAIGLTVAYGMGRLFNVGFQQLRDAIFAPGAQRALRMLALETFQHIHRLSMRYHITRKTGGLSRIIERGVKGVEFLLRFLLFSIGPLILELLMISVIFALYFDMWYLAVLGVTITLYVWFTFQVTEWRVKLRKVMNDQDTDANQKAIDSLLNYETVKYFGAEEREAGRYDSAM